MTTPPWRPPANWRIRLAEIKPLYPFWYPTQLGPSSWGDDRPSSEYEECCGGNLLGPGHEPWCFG